MFPVPPFVELTAPVVLVSWPDWVAVTATDSVQLPPAATVPPVSETPPDPAVAVGVPPQVLASALGVAITIPAGMVSANATPVRATALAAGFVIVKVSVLLPFGATALGANAFAIEGGATTPTLAVAVPPVPPSVEVTAPVVLVCVPPAVPVTFTENVHEPLAARVAPERLTTLVACVAVIVPPPHVPVRPFGVEITSPAGKVSAKPMPERLDPALSFWIVKLSEVEPLSGIDAAPNALMIVGGPTTVIDAFDVLPVPPSVELTCTLLFFTPPVVPVTFTEIVHDALVASVPPDRLAEPAPATAVAVPPHVLVNPLGVATVRPAGRVSVNARPFSATLVFGLATVNVSDVLPLSTIVAAPNAFVIVGGVATARLADAVFPVPPLVELTAPVVLV